MSELGDKQKLFTWLLPLLYDEIHNANFEISEGDGYRDPRSHGAFGEFRYAVGGKRIYGRKFSCHKLKLAKDLNLYMPETGVYVTDTETHRPFGEFWESLYSECRWGGHYNDGNHYSILYRGRQ